MDMKFSVVPSQTTRFPRTWNNSEKNGIYIWKILSDFYTGPSKWIIVILSEHFLNLYKRTNYNDPLWRIDATILLDVLHNYHAEAPPGSCWVEAAHVFSEWKKRILEGGLPLEGVLELVGQEKRTLCGKGASDMCIEKILGLWMNTRLLQRTIRLAKAWEGTTPKGLRAERRLPRSDRARKRCTFNQLPWRDLMKLREFGWDIKKAVLSG